MRKPRLDYLVQNRDRWQKFVNAEINIGLPQNEGNFLTNRGPVCFSTRSIFHVVSWLKVRASCSAVSGYQQHWLTWFHSCQCKIWKEHDFSNVGIQIPEYTASLSKTTFF